MGKEIIKLVKNKKTTIIAFVIIILVSIGVIGGLFIENKHNVTTLKGKNNVAEETSIEKESPVEEAKINDKEEELKVESQFIKKDFTGKTITEVNLRKAPNDDIEYTIGEKSILQVFGEQDGWYKIKHKEKEGWVSAKYIEEYTEEDKKKDDEEKKKDEKIASNIRVTNKSNDNVTVTSNSSEEYKKGFKHQAFSNSRQVILVTAKGMGTSYCNIKFYEKSGEDWKVITETSGRLGSNGLAYISNRKQSTDKTPAGVLNIISAFGVANNPGSRYFYTKVTDEMYWDLNSGSSTYNRLIYNNPGGDYEHLASYPNQYKYALVTDYNNGQVQDKGGAIFLHCNGNGATGGCVSMDETSMREIITRVDPSGNPKILIIPNSDLGSYWN
ncbi:SH3 domain-containing protein [Clostridium algidicarnis]|uniref:SH3 domain-containing protein n=1 Tax=Clostridium algidicarnis TaxID=37659 RepID=UPI00068C5CA9|nr:SH3 domain-containing protein [Clostridium algidicarnis]